MRIFKFLPMFLIGLLLVVSCNDDDDFQVKLSATLISENGTVVQEGITKELTYTVFLSRSVNTDLKLNFGVKDPSKNKGFFEVETPVTIKKGQTKGILKIKVLDTPNYKELTSDLIFTLALNSVEGTKEEIFFNSKNNKFTIKSRATVNPLTESQKALLEGYKAKGMDVAKWIGRIPVKATVKMSGKGSFEPFDKVETKEYEGYVIITLSEKATKDKPILKMVSNAFGLAEYLQWIFRSSTIENTGYWYLPNTPNAPPAPLAVLKALGEDKTQKWIDKGYSFDVSVDDIELNADGTITFVKEDGTYDTYTNFLDPNRAKNLSAVDFEYYFPLWNDLVELAKGNTELQEHIKTGGSIYPNNYIGVSTVLTDDWGEGNWVEPKGTYNATEMNFTFSTDNANSGDYDSVKVTLTAN